LLTFVFEASDMQMSWFLLLLIVVTAGCGRSSRIECSPVDGQVLFDGKPLGEALVVFHPMGSAVPNAPRPIAYSDADGRFALTTLAQSDGAPPGHYAVTVELRAGRLVGEEVVRDGPNTLPARYADPKTSPLKCAVMSGNNELPSFLIESL
jgi:hypothetical protein